MKSFIKEFRAFALRGNVFDLAIGIVIGTAFGAITSSLVADVITPIFGLIIGGLDFSALSLVLAGDAEIAYGKFIQALINFVIIAFALFLVMKGINKLKKKEAEQPSVKSAELTVLEEIRDAIKK